MGAPLHKVSIWCAAVWPADWGLVYVQHSGITCFCAIMLSGQAQLMNREPLSQSCFEACLSTQIQMLMPVSCFQLDIADLRDHHLLHGTWHYNSPTGARLAVQAAEEDREMVPDLLSPPRICFRVESCPIPQTQTSIFSQSVRDWRRSHLPHREGHGDDAIRAGLAVQAADEVGQVVQHRQVVLHGHHILCGVQ